MTSDCDDPNPELALQAAEKVFVSGSLTSAAKASIENKSAIAALKRCAAQNHAQRPVLPQT